MRQKYLTTGQFARALSVSAAAVNMWCASGKLGGCVRTPGGHWRIPASNLSALGVGEPDRVMEAVPHYAAEAPTAERVTPSPSDRPRIRLPHDLIAEFCREHRIRKLALFGSVLRDDFGLESDVDVLVEFEPGQTPGLLRMAEMELHLSDLLGRKTDLRTKEDLSSRFRDEAVGRAEVIYER